MFDAVKTLQAVVSRVDTTSALTRLKAQGQAFAGAYYEFALLKPLAVTHPVVWQEWQRLNRQAQAVKGIVEVINQNLDRANQFASSIFGEDLPDVAGDFLNGYILSSIGTLHYVTTALKNFNRSIALPEKQGLGAGD
jgi:hypothetical protein